MKKKMLIIGTAMAITLVSGVAMGRTIHADPTEEEAHTAQFLNANFENPEDYYCVVDEELCNDKTLFFSVYHDDGRLVCEVRSPREFYSIH